MLFGLPIITWLFVVVGFLAAVVASLVFAKTYRSSSDEWGTIDDLIRRFRR